PAPAAPAKVLTHGVPAWDCEGVYSWVSRVYPSGPFTAQDSRGAQRKLVVPAAELNTVALWCVNTDPTTAQVTAEATAMLDDAATMLQAAVAAVLGGTLTSTCSSAQFTTMVP